MKCKCCGTTEHLYGEDYCDTCVSEDHANKKNYVKDFFTYTTKIFEPTDYIFVENIIKLIPYVHDEQDRNQVSCTIIELKNLGFTKGAIVEYCNYMEEVNPTADEANSIAGMSRLRKHFADIKKGSK